MATARDTLQKEEELVKLKGACCCRNHHRRVQDDLSRACLGKRAKLIAASVVASFRFVSFRFCSAAESMHEAMARSVSEQSQLAVAEAMSTFEETRLAPKLRCAKNQMIFVLPWVYIPLF